MMAGAVEQLLQGGEVEFPQLLGALDDPFEASRLRASPQDRAGASEARDRNVVDFSLVRREQFRRSGLRSRAWPCRWSAPLGEASSADCEADPTATRQRDGWPQRGGQRARRPCSAPPRSAAHDLSRTRHDGAAAGALPGSAFDAEFRPYPSASSCRVETTPCCRDANSSKAMMPPVPYGLVPTGLQSPCGSQVLPPASGLHGDASSWLAAGLAVEAGDGGAVFDDCAVERLGVEGVGEGAAGRLAGAACGRCLCRSRFFFGGRPRPHWIEKSRTPSRASITSSPPLPMKRPRRAGRASRWRGRRRSGRPSRRSPPCPRWSARGGPLSQPLTSSIQAACAWGRR